MHHETSGLEAVFDPYASVRLECLLASGFKGKFRPVATQAPPNSKLWTGLEPLTELVQDLDKISCSDCRSVSLKPFPLLP